MCGILQLPSHFSNIRLVESVRTPSGPRHQIVLNLGPLCLSGDNVEVLRQLHRKIFEAEQGMGWQCVGAGYVERYFVRIKKRR